MRSDRVRLGMLAVVTLLAFPSSALAQTTTNTDAAIAELRQLLVEQRAMLDRQARIIDEQEHWRRCNTGSKVQQRHPLLAIRLQYPRSRPAERLPRRRRTCPRRSFQQESSPVRSAFPGLRSALKFGGQARMVAVHTLKALGTEDRFVTSSIP